MAMTKPISGLLSIVAMAGLMTGAQAAEIAQPGAPAPAFTAPDIAGHAVSLADYAGKTIILEWTNDGCPFVGKHYNSGNMQELQRRFTAAGDIWLTITSSAPGQQGFVSPEEARADMARWNAAPSDYLLDPDGGGGPPLRREGDAAYGGDRSQGRRRLYRRDRRQALDRSRRRKDREKLRSRGSRRACGG
jgi:AhpC/TSA family